MKSNKHIFECKSVRNVVVLSWPPNPSICMSEIESPFQKEKNLSENLYKSQ